MSAEEAIARAKEIAARLAGSGASASFAPGNSDPAPAPVATPVGDVNAVAEAALAAAFGTGSSAVGSSVGSKRKRWGDSSTADPSSQVATSVSDAIAEAMNAKRANTGGSGGSAVQKVWIPVDRNPGYNYIGLLIGPGGSKQRELINMSGGNVKISIRGRGSSSSNAVPGQPEEPLHVLLEGNQENVDTAEKLVSELLNNSEKAQAEKDRQLAVVKATKGGDSPSGALVSSSYTPKPVAQLLGLNGSSHYGPTPGAEVIEEKIGIPNGFVGFIIGKGGESITSMQRKSGCRVQIQKEHEMEPGSTQRIITLTGSTQESISMCRGIIEDMVQERARLNQEQGGGRGGGFSSSGPGSNAAGQAAQLQQALAGGQAHVTVQVPNNDVGLVIGKSGTTIRSIQERSGANVQIPSGPDVGNPMIRTVNITHPDKEGAEFAKTLIEEVLSSKTSHHQGSHGGGAVGSSPSDISVQVQIPDKDVGMCIGKSGCVIREMQQKTQTRIQIPSQPTPGQMCRIATVSGPQEGCQKVQEIINRIIMEQSSQFVMNGTAFGQFGNNNQSYGQYGQQQQYGGGGAAAASGQQADYSAQWANYYASVGQTNGNNAASAPAPAPAPTDAGAQQPAADAYYDAFFRYSYHYGEEAARKYYGAWSPPAGTANPYGVNPNPTVAPTPAPASEQTRSANTAKDSSVRNVSNLPAWMTKS